MTRVSIEIPNTNTSKDEEIESMNHLVRSLIGTGSYLSSLLSPELAKYFAANVKDDFCPDVMAAMEAMERHFNEHAIEVNRNTEATIRGLEAQIKTLAQEKAAAQTEITRQDNTINSLRERAMGAEHAYSELSDEFREANDRLADAATNAEAQAQRILELKARVLDLQDLLAKYQNPAA